MLLILGKNAVKKEREKTPFHIYFIKTHMFLISDGRFLQFLQLKDLNTFKEYDQVVTRLLE